MRPPRAGALAVCAAPASPRGFRGQRPLAGLSAAARLLVPQLHRAVPHDGLGPGRPAVRRGRLHALLPLGVQVSRPRPGPPTHPCPACVPLQEGQCPPTPGGRRRLRPWESELRVRTPEPRVRTTTSSPSGGVHPCAAVHVGVGRCLCARACLHKRGHDSPAAVRVRSLRHGPLPC